MGPNPRFPADLVQFTEETRKGKLHFSCNGENFVLCNFFFYTKIDIADLTSKLMFCLVTIFNK